MKNKSLLIIAIASVLALGGYLVYRNVKHEKVIESQRQDTHNRMIEMTKKNPRSGLAQMARAVKRYYADNKSYPPDLDSLFPKYIESKAFIDDIDWSYKQRGKGFLLSKSIRKNNQNMTVSIDDSLNFKKAKKIMLASRSSKRISEQKRRSLQLRSKESGASILSKVNEISDKTQTSMADMTRTQSAKETMDMVGETRQREMPEEPEEIEEITQIPQRKEPVLIAEAAKSGKKIIDDSGNQYLVWIGKNGHLGFSNVQYPGREEIGYYYLDGKWEAAIR
jgi:hypothetical protein